MPSVMSVIWILPLVSPPPIARTPLLPCPESTTPNAPILPDGLREPQAVCERPVDAADSRRSRWLLSTMGAGEGFCPVCCVKYGW